MKLEIHNPISGH